MLRAIIIDDEYNGVRSLELLLQKFISDVKVVASTIQPLRGVELINNYRPDVVFMDINMPNLNGFQVLESLEFRNFYLVFTTAHREYGLQAIKQDAIDYLLKPIGTQDIKETIEKIKKKIGEKQKAPDVFHLLKELAVAQSPKIALPGKDKIEYIAISDIVYIEANSNSTNLLLDGESELLATSRSLKEYEDILCKEDASFIRIHNSYIINVNFATKYLKEDGGYVVMKEKKTIPISKQKKDEFMKMINLGLG
jgi:two-component system, LytTR family, response regulator